MLTSSTLIAVAIGATRLVVTFWIGRRYGHTLLLPQTLALLCVFLSALPDLIRPVHWPLSFKNTVALMLPDILIRRL